MSRRNRFRKRIVSFLLNLCLLVTAVAGGMSPISVSADDTAGDTLSAAVTGTTQVLYVAGEGGSDENDGTSAEAALATLGAAYKKILIFFDTTKWWQG